MKEKNKLPKGWKEVELGENRKIILSSQSRSRINFYRKSKI